MKSRDMQIAEAVQKATTDSFYGRAVPTLAEIIASIPAQKPYCYVVSGCGTPFYGEFAKHDAEREAKYVGETCKAFPLYTAPPTAEINRQLLDASKELSASLHRIGGSARVGDMEMEALLQAIAAAEKEIGKWKQ